MINIAERVRSLEEKEELKKALTARDIWCLALGAMIGFGCFVLPGNTFLPKAGPMGTALGIMIGAFMVMVISLSFSYLIRQMPQSGGSYLYASVLFGEKHGFILGWFMILTYWSLVPLNATALGLIGRNLFPGILQRGFLYNIAGFDVYAGEILVALLFIVGVGAVNLRGAKSAGWIQTAITMGLLGSVIVVAAGVIMSKPDMNNLEPPFPEGTAGTAAVFSIAAMAPWAFMGFDCVPQAAEEFRFPADRARRIMLTAIAAAAAMYIIINTATSIVFPWQSIIKEDWATGAAVKAVSGNWGLFFVGIAMTCAVLSGMNAFLLSASRLVYAMSKDGSIPPWFGKIDPRTRVPGNALILLTVLSMAAPFLGRQVINWVVDMASVGASLAFAYACAAAFKLSRERKEKQWMYIAFAGLAFSILFLGLLLIPGSPGFLSGPSLIALVIWMILGVILARISRR